MDIIADLSSSSFMNHFDRSSWSIVTRRAVIMVPVVLLWKAKITLRQKFFVGFFLSLSICMILIALVRTTGVRTHGHVIDVQWMIFWNEVEATVATIMVSVTAFRQLIGLKALKARENKDRSWYSYHRGLPFGSSKKSLEKGWETGQPPSIPGATPTGVRTLIRGGRDSKSMTLMTGEDHGILLRHDQLGREKQNIQVTQEISFELETVIMTNSLCPITYTDIDPIRYSESEKCSSILQSA